MTAYLDEKIENIEDLIELADSDSVIVGTIQNGSTVDTTKCSIEEYKEKCIK